MDWLEDHSPMIVDWKTKTIAIPSPQGMLTLWGHDAESTECLIINSLQLQGLCNNNIVAYMVKIYLVEEGEGSISETPGCIQAVIAEFEDVFGEPIKPIRIRPYRHKPQHKDEIERQIEELLRARITQRSSSLFALPVILVKKKDDTWRLYIDYRHLNALTCVAKFLVPSLKNSLMNCMVQGGSSSSISATS